METLVQISFHEIKHSEAVEAAVQKRIQRLQKFFDGIVSVKVILEHADRRHRQGNLFQVRVVLTVPQREIVAGRDSPEDHAHEDIYVAIRDAFDAVQRQLREYARGFRQRKKRPLLANSA